MNDIVNLDQVGVQSKAAKGQGDASDQHFQATKNHAGRMDSMRSQFTGRGGAAFTRAATSNAMGATEVGKRLGELALQAVLGEKAAFQADEQADADQNTAVSTNETTNSLVTKTIHA
ncbi:hypothetical protein [Solicola sp. PLA-1-18]|uniref:hypothetical protein n=1 Tax=Solicola sp. PLA-1-18 TaxID=3380532 RepID=UPI003B7D9AB2